MDEAEFAIERWRALRRSTRHGLSVLHQRFERRLLANIEGLLVNGPEPIERWVLPVLRGDESASNERLMAAALTAASAGHSSAYERLERTALDAGERGLEDPVLDALVSAFCLADGPGLDDELRTRLGRAGGGHLAALLEIFAGRGLDAGETLHAGLRSDDPLIRCAALRAARASDRERWLPWVEQALVSDRDDVRAVAIDTGTAWSSGGAVEAARAWRGSSSPVSNLLVFECAARGGDIRSVAALEERLQQPDTRAVAAWALGFSGQPKATALCVDQLDATDPRVCRLAGDSIAVMLGLSRDDESLWQTPPADAGDSEALPDNSLDPSDEELPTPNAPAIARYWERHRERFLPGQRYLAGAPIGAASPAPSFRSLSSRRTDQWVIGTRADGASWPRRAPAGVLLRWMGGHGHRPPGH